MSLLSSPTLPTVNVSSTQSTNVAPKVVVVSAPTLSSLTSQPTVMTSTEAITNAGGIEALTGTEVSAETLGLYILYSYRIGLESIRFN